MKLTEKLVVFVLILAIFKFVASLAVDLLQLTQHRQHSAEIKTETVEDLPPNLEEIIKIEE